VSLPRVLAGALLELGEEIRDGHHPWVRFLRNRCTKPLGLREATDLVEFVLVAVQRFAWVHFGEEVLKEGSALGDTVRIQLLECNWRSWSRIIGFRWIHHLGDRIRGPEVRGFDRPRSRHV